MQCAAEGKYYAEILGRLRGRASAQLRGSVGRKSPFQWSWAQVSNTKYKSRSAQRFSVIAIIFLESILLIL